tara:strand:- start:5304 stop:5795 length:492 start_codon:yes stop_codon:yes gene_type:complete
MEKINIFEDMDKDQEIKYNSWSSHLNNTRDRTNYATRRMDLLIISICGAGIYTIFETFKAITSEDLIIDNISSLKVSGIVFLIAITSNFLSQLTGFYANNNEEKYTLIEMCSIEGKEVDVSKQQRYDQLSNWFTKATRILNAISMGLMFIGLFLLAYFNYSLF